jgi:cation-transporting ATPase 13A2
MACCHSCTYVGNNLIGDPLETEMFKLSKWVMDEDEDFNRIGDKRYLASFYPKKLVNVIRNNDHPEQQLYKLSLCMKNEFISELQRMSVVVKNNLDGNMICFLKGSPEEVYNLCDPDKVPNDFNSQLDIIVSKGLRIIALAYRELDDFVYDPDNLPDREDLEKVRSHFSQL